MEKSGPNFYDEAHVFDAYSKLRSQPQSANETIEQPILWDLIGSSQGMDVLDLGCGDANVSKRHQISGARSYVGVDGAKRMIALAQKNIQPGFSQIYHFDLLEFDYPKESFDLVTASLSLHYIRDLRALLEKIYFSLRPNGRLIFSVEHPVITSCNLSLDQNTQRESWIVDNYFSQGSRTVQWMGDTVTKYHRTIEEFLSLLKNAGFGLENLKEGQPEEKFFENKMLFARRQRIPLFLIIEARKRDVAAQAPSRSKL